MLNTNALCTLDQAKQYLGIESSDTSKDFILEIYINGLSDSILGNGNTILKTDYTEKYKGLNTQDLVLKHRPINSVASLKQYGSDILGYEILSNQGVLYKDSGWFSAYSNAPMMHDVQNYISKDIEITYNAGYDQTPSDLLMLFLSMLKSQYEYDVLIKSNLKGYKISDVSWTWGDSIKALSPEQTKIINKYIGIKI